MTKTSAERQKRNGPVTENPSEAQEIRENRIYSPVESGVMPGEEPIRAFHDITPVKVHVFPNPVWPSIKTGLR